MFSLSDKVPDYLLGKFQMIWTVTFTTLFSLVFVLLSLPFSHNAWFALSTPQAFRYTVAFFLIAILFLSASRRTLYYLRHRFIITYLTFITWSIIEMVLISFIYVFFTIKGHQLELIVLKRPVDELVAMSLVYSIVLLGVPNLISAMFFALQDKDNTIRMINFGNVISDDVSGARGAENKITLFDNSGTLKLSINADNLFYIESDDNYIKVWYSDTHNMLKQYMLRCRLKTIEESFSGSNLVRCHRKYIVNISKVDILTHEKDCYMLDLGNDAIAPIPISKSYEEQVLARFNSKG